MALTLPIGALLTLLIYGFREGYLEKEDVLNYVVAVVAPNAVGIALHMAMLPYFAILWMIAVVLALAYKCGLSLRIPRCR